MPCKVYNSVIICYPKLRKFRWRGKYYNVEGGYNRGISNMNADVLYPEDFPKKTKRKFYKEMNKGV